MNVRNQFFVQSLHNFSIVSLAIVLAGCVIGPTPFLPATWKQHTASIQPVSQRLDTPRLQILIMYSGLSSSHTALRLVQPGHAVLLWDPAGDYARFDADNVFWRGTTPRRIRDLISHQPPDLEIYIKFRWELDDTSVEVFEWDISPALANHFATILREGTDDSHPAGRFSSLTWPALCTVAVSDFLQRFAKPVLQIQDWYFFPHNLAKVLYTQNPHRVRIFTPDQPQIEYLPPHLQPAAIDPSSTLKWSAR